MLVAAAFLRGVGWTRRSTLTSTRQLKPSDAVTAPASDHATLYGVKLGNSLNDDWKLCKNEYFL